MTRRLRQICGCEICIIPKGIYIGLNIFRTTVLSDLQYMSVGRHTHSTAYSTTSAAHYKDKVFPDGECLHVTIKYSAQWISCTTIKPNNIIHMKCALDFCDKFPKYIIPEFYIVSFQCVTRYFMKIWNWQRGGGHFYMQKECTLCYIFINKKMYFVLRLYI